MKVKILTTRPEGCGIGDYTKKIIQGLKYKYLTVEPVYIKENSLNIFHYLSALKNCIFGSDIVHIQFNYSFFGGFWKIPGIYLPIFYFALWLAQRYKFKNKTNIITTLHEFRDPKKCKLGFYYSFLNKIVATHSDILIALSNETRAILIEQGVPERKIKVIEHGILLKPKIYDSNLAKQELCKKLGLKPSDYIVTILGYIHKNKGHDRAIEAIKELDSNVKLIIIGEPRTKEHKPYISYLKNMIKENGLEKRVIFCGFIEDDKLPVFLNATDLMILPYREIRQSGIFNYAMAYHLPIITSDLPFFREIEARYGCIRIFTNNLSNDIDYLLKHADYRQYLRKKAKEYAEMNSYERTCFELYKIYLCVGEADHPAIIYRDNAQKERVRFLIRHIKGEKVLEVGCATGYILRKVYEERKIEGIGIDIRKDRLLYGKITYRNLDFISASGEFLPFKDESFDTVLLPDILEHVDYEKAIAILKEGKRVGKKVLVSVPTPTGKWFDNPEHVWRPTLEAVSALDTDIKVVVTKDFTYGIIEK